MQCLVSQITAKNNLKTLNFLFKKKKKFTQNLHYQKFLLKGSTRNLNKFTLNNKFAWLVLVDTHT